MSMHRTSLGVALLLAMAVNGTYAQNTPVVSAYASIGAHAAVGVTGAITVNATAGLDNAQANQVALGMGTPGTSGADSTQTAFAHARTGFAAARVESAAFSNISGAVLVNQSAGSANLQRNSVVVGTLSAGVEIASDRELSEATSRQGGLRQWAGARDMRQVSIGNSAFKNVSGVVQVNQTAGAGNATANSFVLRPPAGTFFN
ncbi:hypothetical protein [Burkholderia pseudomallei]|uniref:hypothetical protein n=1 Tax=Burkholderia pseudomallei TaxID=28450 RepID=UPI00016ABB7A|nr:hypothetical protein [Burkholderia pseudomallei]KGD42045.1 hypothetical protein DP44_4460 [Burkholderia pseudomallei]KGD54643.1 hypothetical protein DP49_1375 [Burkholderia pseudomallei]KGR92897.1 hypothetical protein X948_5779 [Burkholderia pseudomallei MSHR5608]KGS28928.1 hypothetical protein X962_3455 [Burkholderia pseudomallei MSHR7343]KGS81921.1 hypothetical protein X942_663 [Burkholderia pseudomallei MSHR5596]